MKVLIVLVQDRIIKLLHMQAVCFIPYFAYRNNYIYFLHC